MRQLQRQPYNFYHSFLCNSSFRIYNNSGIGCAYPSGCYSEDPGAANYF